MEVIESMPEPMPGARCFCCFEDGAAMPCGCLCRTAFACAGCMWQLVAPADLEGPEERAPSKRCKVCLECYSDAAVLAGCRHARAAAAGLGAAAADALADAPADAPADAQADSSARRELDVHVMETLLLIRDRDAALGLAREVYDAYKAAMGPQHLTTTHFGALFAQVLFHVGEEKAAVPLFSSCAAVQAGMVGTWDLSAASERDCRWMYRTYRTRMSLLTGMICLNGKDAEYQTQQVADHIQEELLKLLMNLGQLLSACHPDYVCLSLIFADFVHFRVQRELADGPARTRAQHALVRVGREAVEYAVEAVSLLHGADCPMLEHLLCLRAELAARGCACEGGAGAGAGGPAGAGAGSPAGAGGAQ